MSMEGQERGRKEGDHEPGADGRKERRGDVGREHRTAATASEEGEAEGKIETTGTKEGRTVGKNGKRRGHEGSTARRKGGGKHSRTTRREREGLKKRRAGRKNVAHTCELRPNTG